MENHPIPQDVTGFQFKLIGNMTVKQFAYIVAGVIGAWIFISLSIPFLLKIPFVSLFLLLGFSLAFVPFEGRPLDSMISHFIRALFSPNQYVYQKYGTPLTVLISLEPVHNVPRTTISHQKEKLDILLTTVHQKNSTPLDLHEEAFQRLIATNKSPLPMAPTPVVPQSQAQQPAPVISTAPLITVSTPVAPNQTKKEDDFDEKQNKPKAFVFKHAPASVKSDEPKILEKESEETAEQQKEAAEKEEQIQKELDAAKQEEANQKDTAKGEEAHEKVATLETQMQELAFQKEQLEKKLQELSQEFVAKPAQVAAPKAPPPPVPLVKPVSPPQPFPIASGTSTFGSVHNIQKGMAVSAGLPIAPEAPNLITGIIKDARGNSLINMLIEVKDKDGNPVRAFKTNTLGQFASATSLPNGTYNIEFEDPEGNHRFDPLTIQATGEIILPIEVISTDAREDLRKDLFWPEKPV